MNFNKVKGKLGFGCMRLKMVEDKVDYQEFCRMIDTLSPPDSTILTPLTDTSTGKVKPLYATVSLQDITEKITY